MRSAPRTGPTPTSGPPASGGTGSWASVTASTRPTTIPLRPVVPWQYPTNLVRVRTIRKEQGMGGANDITSGGPGRVRALFSFPNPVNEVSARLVAAGVVLLCVLTMALDLRWATIVIA